MFKSYLLIPILFLLVLISTSIAGLVIAYDFEDGGPGGVTADVSGVAPAMDATLNNAVIVTDPDPARNLVLDPSGAYPGVGNVAAVANLTSKFDLGRTFAVSAWVKVKLPQDPCDAGQWRYITGQGGAGPRIFAVDAGMVGAVQTSDSGWDPVGYTQALPGTETWQHIVLSYDGFDLVAYVDGVEVDRVERGGFVLDQALPWSIGFQADDVNGVSFKGYIDDVAVWEGFLDATAVQALYDGTETVLTVTDSPLEAGLVEVSDANMLGWWHFEDGVGSRTFMDLAPNPADDGKLFNDANIVVDPCRGNVLLLNQYELQGDREDYGLVGRDPKFDEFVGCAISAWVKRDSFLLDDGNPDGNWKIIQDFGSFGPRSWMVGNSFKFAINTNASSWDGSHVDGGFGMATEGQWIHFATAFEPNIPEGPNDPCEGWLKMYIDGALVAESFGSTYIHWSIAGTDMKVGGPHTSWTDYWNGSLDDIRFYNFGPGPREVAWITSDGDPSLEAWIPIPSNGATDVPMNQQLSWTEGKDAAFHDVWFGTDPDNLVQIVNNQPLGNETANPGTLTLSQTYYWRVDEVNSSGEVEWPGDLWSFTVADNMVLDDFESYTSNTQLRNTWVKAGSASQSIGLGDAEVCGDLQSLKISYSTLSGVTASVTRTFASVIDFTQMDIAAMDITIKGSSANLAADISIILTDQFNQTAEVFNPDNTVVQDPNCTTWRIALSEFTDVTPSLVMQAISKITIKISNYTNFTGNNVFFDDIRLYQPRCFPDQVPTDLTGDCDVTFDDFDIMASEWAFEDRYIAGQLTTLANFNSTPVTDVSGYVQLADVEMHNNATTVYDGTRTSNVLSLPNTNLEVPDYATMTIPSDYEGDKYDFTAGCTMIGWIKPTSYSFEQFYLMGVGGAGPRIFQYGLFNLRYYFNAGDSDSETGVLEVSNVFDVGLNWKLIACTYDPYNSVIKVFVNGVQKASVEGIDGYAADGGDVFYIGAYPVVPSDVGYFAGKFDDVALFNRALSAQDIADIYNKVKTLTSFSPVQLYVGMDYIESNIFDEEPEGSKAVNFRDFATMAADWLAGPILWP